MSAYDRAELSALGNLIRGWDDARRPPHKYRPRDIEDLEEVLEKEYVLIPRSELPTVYSAGDGAWFSAIKVVGGHTVSVATQPDPETSTSEYHRAQAVAHLALAEYLAAHPPADERDVEALAETLAGEMHADADDTDEVRTLARRLLATGKVTVTGGEDR